MDLAQMENILTTLKSDSQIKKNVYTELQSYINNQPLTSISEERLLIVIKKHLKENVLVNEALKTWVAYIQKSKIVTEDFIQNVYDYSKDFNLLIPLFCQLLAENLLDMEKIISSNNIDLNKKVINCLIKLSDKVTFKMYHSLINNEVVKIIYISKNDETRNILIDFVLSKHTVYPLTFYSSDEQKKIAATFKNSYVQVIDDLRMQNNKNWYKLCMFTMKYCGKLLHSEIELTNAILRSVEIGFKTKTIQDRLMSYECWKVLIDICNLDPNYICNSKQLRLLVKPLKVKLSKNEDIIRKRFEVWFYLVKILQEKLILCLEEFMRFCFELSNNNSISELDIRCDVFKYTWGTRIEVLMAIIGHSTHEGSCLEMKEFNFETALVTSTNFLEYDDLFINSIYVACKMISTWDDSEGKGNKVRCLWGTLFKIIQNLNENSKESILHKISKVLNCLLQDTIHNERIFDDVVLPIFSLLSHFEEPICNSLLLHEIIIFPIIRFMLSQQTVKTEWSKDVVNLIRDIPKTGNKLFYFNRVCELLKTNSRTNSTFVVYFWLQLSDDLYDICKTPREGFSDFKEDAMYFLTRIFSCRNFEDMRNIVLPKWRNIFSEICAISAVFGENLLENAEKLVKKQPETINNLLSFLTDISQVLLEEKSSKKYVVGLLNVIFYCLQNPCTPKDKIIMTVGVLKKVVTFCLNSDNVESEAVISRMYECIEYLLKPHEVLEVLEVFKEVIPKLTNSTKQKIPNSLKTILDELTVNSDILISKDAVAILAQLDMEETKTESKPLFVKPITVSARTAKIANMAKENGIATSPKGSMLKMFANDQKNNKKEIGVSNKCISPRSRTKKMVKAMPSTRFSEKMKRIDDDSREFVLIDKEVKLDKRKMSEHQKEMSRKRREDIPALYQDLSQSQNSNGNISSSSISNDGTSSNKSDLMLDEHFKEMITDLKNKNNILQENINAELNDTVQIDLQKNIINSDSSIIGTFTKDIISEHKSSLPKYDLNVNFEKALESQRNEISSSEAKINHGGETIKNTPAFCSSKFEEQVAKTEAAQAPIFPDCNLDGMCGSSDKNPKKRPKNQSLRSKETQMQSGTDLNETRNKLLRNRTMSDSRIELGTPCLNSSTYEFERENELLQNVELAKENLRKSSKQLKTKTREIKGRRKKSPFTNSKQYKTLKYIHDRRRRKSYEDTYRNDLQVNLELKKKYKSLENLNDMARKRKKCFKIIRNDSELSSSIKLRISITDEKDNNPESDIIEQLDTEISKIDANLKNFEAAMPPNNDSLISQSLFGSSEALLDSQLGDLNNVEVLNKASESTKSKLDVLLKTDTVDDAIVHSASNVEELEESFNIETSLNEQNVNIKKRRQRELDRIKMDIVGAEDFIMTTPRKRRAPKLLDADLLKANVHNKTSSQTTTENLTPQVTTPEKKLNKKKSPSENKNKSSPNKELPKKSLTPNSTKTPTTSRKSHQFGSTNRRKRKPNSAVLKEVIESVTNTDQVIEADESNDELLCKSYEEIINLSDNTPTKSRTNIVKRRSKLKTTNNQVLKNTPKSVKPPKVEEPKRQGRKNQTNTPTSPLLVGNSKSTPKRSGRKDFNKNSLRSVATRRSLSNVDRDSQSLQQSVMDSDLIENSENIIESSQDTSELLALSIRTLKKSQKPIEKLKEIPSLEELASLVLVNATDDAWDRKPIDYQDEPQIFDENHQQVKLHISNAPSVNKETQKIASSNAVESCKSPEQSTEYICEINGVAINNRNNGGGSEIYTCQTYVDDSDDAEVTDEEISALHQPDIQNAMDDQIINKNIETDDASDDMQIKEEITIINHNVMDYYNSYAGVKIEQEMEDKDVKPKVTEASNIKSESIQPDETLTCDPYTNINNDKDVLEKLERDGPGAARTIIRDLNFDSLPIVFETTPKKGNIPGSPVCEDTPDRNKEFLNNTLDISPIKTEFLSIEVLDKDVKTPVTTSDRSYIKKPSSRSAKLLNLLPCNNEITPLKSSRNLVKKSAVSSEASTTPSTQRIRKMILNCGIAPQATANVKEEDDNGIVEDITCGIPTVRVNVIAEDAILKFTRELPSPLATPNSSILKKRKLSEIDESIAPSAKRPKRVNFSDPPITCKKIYFMENDEKSDDSNNVSSESSISIMGNLNLPKANSICSKLSTCTEDINEIVTLLDENVLTHFLSINVKTVGDLAVLNETQINRLEFLSEPRLIRIIDALDVFYLNYAEKDKVSTDRTTVAIYPNLVDCTHSIQNILKHIGNVKTAKDLRLKGIVTIGDVAKLTSAEITQLSLKPANIINALNKYQRRLNKDKILAKQMEEEMKEENAATIYLHDTSESQTSNADNCFEVVEVKDIKVDIKPVLDKAIDTPSENAKSLKEKALKELIQHIKENYSIDEMRFIFDELFKQ